MIHRRDLWVPACIVALTAAVAAGTWGAASYNEGDNDDQPANPCAELRPEDRPVNCEE